MVLFCVAHPHQDCSGERKKKKWNPQKQLNIPQQTQIWWNWRAWWDATAGAQDGGERFLCHGPDNKWYADLGKSHFSNPQIF